MAWKKFIILGDSNTQFGFSVDSGWVSKISDLLQRKCDVVNRGFSGYNTDHIKTMLPDIFGEFDSKLICGVVVMLGSNDSTMNTNQIQHVPLERYKQNLKHIIDYLLSLNIQRESIILVSCPMINDAKWLEESRRMNREVSHSNKLVTDYAKSSIEIAKEKGASFVDFHKVMRDYGDGYGELLKDGLHLSEKGGSLLFNSILPVINKQINDKLKFNYPYWKDLQPGQTKIDQ